MFGDIFPDAVKTGMLFSAPLINAAACKLDEYGAANIVVDPVMVSASGDSLVSPDAAAALKERLFPLATLITPNIPDAEVLIGLKISGKDDMEAAARAMRDEFGCAVLLKGGHSAGDADDLLCSGAGLKWFCAARVENPNTHGTGCTLSSAIAASLAKGCPLEDAVQKAKDCVTGALAAMLNLGKGSGPLNHSFLLG